MKAAVSPWFFEEGRTYRLTLKACEEQLYDKPLPVYTQ